MIYLEDRSRRWWGYESMWYCL